MKKLFIYIALLLSVTANAAVINVGDTTLTSNWNAGGNIMNITGKISGAYTISNAIIQANSFIQIFDTSVMLGSGIYCDKFSAMWYGAKPANADNSVYLQKAINATQDRGYWLYIPYGVYRTSQPLMVIKGSYGAYQQTSIKIFGEASFWDNDIGTQILYSGDSCAIGLQLNKGSVIRNLRIKGGWVSPGGTDSTYFNILFANYGNQGTSGNGAGIWIDPVGNWNQRSGSTGCKFTDLKIEGFKTLVQIGNWISQNDEIMIFDNIQLGNAQVGFQSTQAQEKGNILRGIYSWGSIHTIFNQGGQAGNYYIDGANIAGRCIRIFNINAGGFFPSHFEKIYAENIAQIGTINSTGLPISIEKSLFDFIVPSTVGNITLLTTNSPSVKFSNTTFRYYGANNALKILGSGTFDNCFFSNTQITGIAGSVFVDYYNGTMNVSGTKTVTVITDTIKSNPVKVELRKSYLSQ